MSFNFGGGGGTAGGGGFSFGGSAGGTQTTAASIGTSQVPFQPTEVRDNKGATRRFQTLTMMPQYANKSTEELRYEDLTKRAASSVGATTSAPAQQQVH
ncbi:MAG: hypothetical protein MHM6MM_003877 [Cercozoa sp. M6MM]